MSGVELLGIVDAAQTLPWGFMSCSTAVAGSIQNLHLQKQNAKAKLFLPRIYDSVISDWELQRWKAKLILALELWKYKTSQTMDVPGRRHNITQMRGADLQQEGEGRLAA